MGIGSNTLLEGDGLLFVDRLGLVGTDGRIDGHVDALERNAAFEYGVQVTIDELLVHVVVELVLNQDRQAAQDEGRQQLVNAEHTTKRLDEVMPYDDGDSTRQHACDGA